MQKKIQIKVPVADASNEQIIRNLLAKETGQPAGNITGFHLLKKSLDARSKYPHILITATVFINEPFRKHDSDQQPLRDVKQSAKSVLIIGAGPAGLFAALSLIRSGIRPIIVERGKDVRARRRDLAILNKEGVIDPESNYCFGEGGAGTYSDGKLYTRSKKRGDLDRVLNIFVQFGANENILYEAHPHIGTNKLPLIITDMREKIRKAGGMFLFNKKVVDLIIQADEVIAVITSDGETFKGDAVILATGHSARDVFSLLQDKKLMIHFKPFALGVRVEHPQTLIDSMQYHCTPRVAHLPPASYSLVEQVEGRMFDRIWGRRTFSTY